MRVDQARTLNRAEPAPGDSALAGHRAIAHSAIASVTESCRPPSQFTITRRAPNANAPNNGQPSHRAITQPKRLQSLKAADQITTGTPLNRRRIRRLWPVYHALARQKITSVTESCETAEPASRHPSTQPQPSLGYESQTCLCLETVTPLDQLPRLHARKPPQPPEAAGRQVSFTVGGHRQQGTRR